MIRISELDLILKILLFISFVISFVYIFWLAERKHLKNETIFDISIGLLVGGGVFARIVGMLSSTIDYSSRLWSLLPVADMVGSVEYFYTMPWAFFDVFDKQLSFVGFLLGIAIVLSGIYHKSNKMRNIFAVYDSVFFSVIISSLIFLVASVFGQFDYGIIDESLKSGIIYANEGALRFPVQLYQGSMVLGLWLSYIVLKRYVHKDGLWTGVFLTIIGAFEFYIHYRSAFYSPIYFNEIDLYQVISLCLFLIGLYIIVSTLSINFFVKKKESSIQEVKPRALDGNHSRLDTARKTSNKSITSFSQSFADRQNSIMDHLREQEGE